MEARIDMLEREVSAIKSEIAVIKSACSTREEARAMDANAAVAELQIDVALMKMQIQMSHLLTKEDLKEFQTNLIMWMVAQACIIIGAMSGIQFALYSAFRH
jgi:Spy/CpxP family protein refolding chaperone